MAVWLRLPTSKTPKTRPDVELMTLTYRGSLDLSFMHLVRQILQFRGCSWFEALTLNAGLRGLWRLQLLYVVSLGV